MFSNPLEGYGLFKTFDESRLDQFTFYYMLVYDGKSLAAIAPCFTVDYSLDTSVSGPLRRVIDRIKRYRPGIFSVKVFACGFPMGESNIGMSAGAGAVIDAVVSKMERLARRVRAPLVVFKDFGGSYDGILGGLRRKGFSRYNSLPITKMDVRFPDFEAYLMALNRKSRYDLRRKFKKVDGRVKIGMEVVSQPDEDMYRDIYRLYNSVVDKHDFKFEVIPVDFFKNLAANMPDNARYFIWRIDGKIIAFSLCLVSEDTLSGYYIGMDYSIAYDYHLYFVKLRDIVKWCISRGIKRYELGYMGYETKLRLGFELVPLYVYVKLRNRLLRPLFRLACEFLKLESSDASMKNMLNNKARR
jgi:hypothetical protein